MTPTTQTSSVRLGIRLLLALLVALAVPAVVSAQAHAATVTQKVGSIPGVYGYGAAHCNPAYTRSIAVQGPWVAKVLPPSAGSLGMQTVRWQPFIEKWTGSGWKRWWGPAQDGGYSVRDAWFDSEYFSPGQLTGGGSGYYRAGGVIAWGAAWGYPSGGIQYLLTAGDYLVGGGANSHLATRVTDGHCWVNA